MKPRTVGAKAWMARCMKAESALRELLRSSPGGLDCENFHHPAKWLHGASCPCPALNAYILAVLVARDTLPSRAPSKSVGA